MVRRKGSRLLPLSVPLRRSSIEISKTSEMWTAPQTPNIPTPRLMSPTPLEPAVFPQPNSALEPTIEEPNVEDFLMPSTPALDQDPEKLEHTDFSALNFKWNEIMRPTAVLEEAGYDDSDVEFYTNDSIIATSVVILSPGKPKVINISRSNSVRSRSSRNSSALSPHSYDSSSSGSLYMSHNRSGSGASDDGSGTTYSPISPSSSKWSLSSEYKDAMEASPRAEAFQGKLSQITQKACGLQLPSGAPMEQYEPHNRLRHESPMSWI